METKTNRHDTESINQQGATRAVIVSRLAPRLQWKRLWTWRHQKGALFKKKGEVFASEGSADTLLKTKKGTRGTANAYWSTWPQAQRSSSPGTTASPGGEPPGGVEEGGRASQLAWLQPFELLCVWRFRVIGQCKVSQKNRGPILEDEGTGGVPRQGLRGEDLQEVQVQDRGCPHH